MKQLTDKTRRRKKPQAKPKPPAKAKQAAKPKRRRGRPDGVGAFKPTEKDRQIVEFMAGIGVPEDEMVKILLNPETNNPITPVTLRKHFRAELDRGFVNANTKVAAALYTNATTKTETYPGGIPVAQIFWLKTRARWSPNAVPPPPPPAEDTNVMDAARRIAFVLAAGAQDKKKLKQPG